MIVHRPDFQRRDPALAAAEELGLEFTFWVFVVQLVRQLNSVSAGRIAL